jgi:hypothetical protein
LEQLKSINSQISPGSCPEENTYENPCKNFGICISAPGGHSCLCKVGWSGPSCEQGEKILCFIIPVIKQMIIEFKKKYKRVSSTVNYLCLNN